MTVRRIAIVILGLVVTGCAGGPKATETTDLAHLVMDELYETHFETFNPPTAQRVHEDGVSRVYAELDFESLWSANLRILMQKGVIVHCSKRSGTIVCMESAPRSTRQLQAFLKTGLPTVILVERAHSTNPPRVTVNWLTELYVKVDTPGRKIVDLGPGPRDLLARAYFDRLEIEAAPRKKWKYLFE